MLSRVTFVALSTVLLLPAALGYTKLLDIGKGAIVHLLEWKWDDIARECEEFLAPKGYAAVETSPPHENLVVKGRPWEERLQVVSYKLISRSGNETQLISMLKRCNNVGVRVFAHAVINHMTANTDECVGVGGSKCNAFEMDYPAVPYTKEDFHPPCLLRYTKNAREMRECELFGFHDLNQKRKNVQDRIVEYLNHLIAIGYAGFRIDAAMHMYPSDLDEIYHRLDNLNSRIHLPEDTRPFIYQEIFDMGDEAVSYTEYTPMGLITDLRYRNELVGLINDNGPLHDLRHFGLSSDSLSLVFVDDYEIEKQQLKLLQLNYKSAQRYKLAIAFMLAWGQGYPQILSSYKFEGEHDGPPADSNENILSPNPDKNNVCENGWVCQHRWRQIYAMVAFNKATFLTQVTSWWDNGSRQIAFSRGNKGFVAFNMENKPLKAILQTNLPPGKYCDVISGLLVNGKCEGKTIEVNKHGYAEINIQAYNEFDDKHDGVLAIIDHESSRLAKSLYSTVLTTIFRDWLNKFY